jgi:hypothetical protein
MRQFVSVLLVFLFSATTFPQTDNGCGLKFTGKARKLVDLHIQIGDKASPFKQDQIMCEQK